ncbi:uncharacterized protein [Oryza sativa Japonica Group]|uniref:DUF1409 domain-containing protein n=1 Tax=Oryza sativa subsp. japonica TaxID=39947 RepID=Q2QYW8_ORYSJ|nr:hypothetical protein LOC_Os12g01340 [Oryza sativa Japonica Group]USI00078.1 putative Ty3-gypsy subclass retrotransposon protein [Oryza sativa Japonica Group]
MSTSASPSVAPSAEYAEVSIHWLDLFLLQHIGFLLPHIVFFFSILVCIHSICPICAIPSLSHENHYFLGPIGDSDPTEFIIAETNRIPFRLANPNLSHWKNTFKSWPSLEKTSPEKSWTTWYKRVSASKQVHWDDIGIGQALALTIANSAKDEPLMAAATYFWSNAINAFLFNQGPMTPTLIDITMITGLDVTSSANPMSLNTKNQFDFRTKSIGGRNIQVSYEFYHPMSSARQFGMGQLPIGLFFADKIQCRGEISSTLMMDQLLNIPGPPLGNIENIELARFRSKNFDRWWGEWKKHIFHQPASMYMTDLFPDVIPQTTESSPTRKSNSGRDIEYAPGLIPNGGGPSPPVIGYNAPKTSTLLQGLIRESADAGKKRKTRSLAVDPSAQAPKKKTKSQKTKPTDDLPALDSSIEQALDEEEIEEDVDQAAAEKKKTAVRKKSAAATLKPAPPPPPPPVQTESSDHSPSAAGSHNVDEEEQPAAPTIPVLADLFSFDIKDYLDETEEDTSSKALAPLSDDVKKTLEDISHWLEASSLDSLVVDCGSIRTRLHEVQALIPDELADALTPAVYLEQHQFKLEKAKLRLAERRERKDIEATIQINRQLVHEEKSKLD